MGGNQGFNVFVHDLKKDLKDLKKELEEFGPEDDQKVTRVLIDFSVLYRIIVATNGNTKKRNEYEEYSSFCFVL